MLTKNEIIDRIDLLFACLIFSSEKVGVFKTAERICINQERGALLDLKNYLDGNIKLHDVREYRVPASIEEKIKSCQNMMARSDWDVEAHIEFRNINN